MADPVEVAIEAALLEHMGGLSPAVPVAYPDRPFVPPNVEGADNRHLRVSFLPAPTSAVAIAFAGHQQHLGILQITACQSQGRGELALARLAAEVVAHFKRGTVLHRDGFAIRIDDPPYRGPLIPDAPWALIPVSVPYRCFARNPA